MADFKERHAEFEAQGVQVVAASSETLEDARKTVNASGVVFPVGYGIRPEAFAKRFGAFYSDDGTYLHATGFLIDPQGLVDISVYSCGAIGRFTAADALQILTYRLKPED